MPTSSRSQQALTTFIDSLSLLQKIAETAPVPILKGAVGTAILIAGTVKNAKRNQDVCYELCDKISRLVLTVHLQSQERGANLDAGLEERVAALDRCLLAAHEKMIRLARKSILRRITFHTSDADEIQGIQDDIEEARKIFDLKTRIATAVDVKYIRDESVRKRITEGADYGGWRPASRCLPGTRLHYINEISTWSTDADAESVCWLTGVAGSGKSAIAHEIAGSVHDQRSMYSCFFFKRDDPSISASAIQLLAFGLSHCNANLSRAITQAMDRLHDVRVTPSFPQQFEHFIVGPLREFSASNSSTPVLLILDALDECPPDIRPEMIQALRSGATQLPKNVKILLTSRPRSDISVHIETLSPKFIHINVGLTHDDGDVERYIKTQLLQICQGKRLQSSWSDDSIASDAFALSKQACGLFQWANVACALIRKRFSPRDTIKRILTLATSEDSQVNLDTIYIDSLHQVFPDSADDVELRDVYSRVIGAIVSAKEPLGILALRDLLNIDENIIDLLLSDLGCVISVESEHRDRVAHIAHPSFFDFITDSTRCTDTIFHIDFAHASQQLALQCLNLTLNGLHRDLCSIKHPQFDNDIVGDEIRCLPGGLRYACRFLLVHTDDDVARSFPLLDRFFDTKLLEWIEAMSLFRQMDTAATLLNSFQMKERSLMSPAEVQNHRAEMLYDATRFVGRFGSIISQGALHVYYSALPLMPQHSLLYRTYAQQYSDIPRIVHGYESEWTPDLFTTDLPGFYGIESYLEFSADSARLLAIGSGMRMFSAFTGAETAYCRAGRYERTCGTSSLSHMVAIHRKEGYGDDQQHLVVYDLLSSSQAEFIQVSADLKILALSFDCDGYSLFAGYDDGRIQAWKTHTWQPADLAIKPHFSAVRGLVVSNSLLASISEEELRITKYENGLCMPIFSMAGGIKVSFLSVSPAEWISAVLCDSQIRIDSTLLLDQVILPVNPVEHAITPCTKKLVTIDNLTSATLWDITSRTCLTQLQMPNLDRPADAITSISRDGRLFAVLSDNGLVHVRSLDFNNYKSIPDPTPRKTVTEVLSVTSRGTRIYVGHLSGMISIWDSVSTECISKFSVASTPVYSLAVSTNGDVLALRAGRYSDCERLFIVSKTGTLQYTILDQSSNSSSISNCLSISSDSSSVATKYQSGEIGILDLHRNPESITITSSYRQLGFSDDGKLLAAFDTSSLRVYQIAKGKSMYYSWKNQISRGTDEYYTTTVVVRFSPDMTKVVHLVPGSVLSRNGLITVCDIDGGAAQSVDFDPTPMMSGIIVHDPHEGWVYDGLGRRLWRLPLPFRSYHALPAVGWAPSHSSSSGYLAVITKERSLVIIDANAMLASLQNASSFTLPQQSLADVVINRPSICRSDDISPERRPSFPRWHFSRPTTWTWT